VLIYDDYILSQLGVNDPDKINRLESFNHHDFLPMNTRGKHHLLMMSSR